jgi:hypothetical protein
MIFYLFFSSLLLSKFLASSSIFFDRRIIRTNKISSRKEFVAQKFFSENNEQIFVVPYLVCLASIVTEQKKKANKNKQQPK